MYLADYHVHSRVSPDASYPMAEMTRAAITNGIDEICFTDHVEPMEWGGLELREPYNWNDLLNPFKRAQEVAGDRVKVRLGIELGDAVYDLKHTEKLLADLPEDAVVSVRTSEYGAQALVVKSAVSNAFAPERPLMEDIILFMVKGGKPV